MFPIFFIGRHCMNCIHCDGEINGPMIRVRQEIVCSVQCARNYERDIKDYWKSVELMREWVFR